MIFDSSALNAFASPVSPHLFFNSRSKSCGSRCMYVGPLDLGRKQFLATLEQMSVAYWIDQSP